MSKPLFQGAGISTTLLKPRNIVLFSQLTDTELLRIDDVDGNLHPSESLKAPAVPLTPLASIAYSQGKKAHVFYVDEKYILQELIFHDGKWEKGPIAKYGFSALPGSGISATAQDGVPRVFYQDKETQNIVGLYFYSRQWEVDDYLTVKDALPGTSISAVPTQESENIQLYYQDRRLHLKRYLRIDDNWSQDQKFDFGIAPSRTSISAIAFRENQTQIYWGNEKHEIVFRSSDGAGGWRPVVRVIGGFPLGHKFAALQPNNGEVRLYYQDTNAFLHEIRSDDGGGIWYPGNVHAG